MAGKNTHAPTHDRQSRWDDEVTAWLATVTPIVAEHAASVDAAFAAIGADSGLRDRLAARLLPDAG